MTSTRALGNKIERLAESEMEAHGWLVERARGVILWIGPGRPITKKVDFFGAFDFVCICAAGARAYHTAPGMHFIQVTAGPTAANVSIRRKKIEAIYPRLPLGSSAEMWYYRTGRKLKSDRTPRGWQRERLMGGDWVRFFP